MRLNNMRVLHIVEATTAGVRRYVQTLVQTSNHRRFESHVACPPQREGSFGDIRFVRDLERAGVPFFPVPMSRSISPLPDAHALRQLVSLIRAGHYDIVHTHSSKAGFLGRIAARIAGTPVVHTPNGLYFLGLRSPAKRRFYLALEQFASRLSSRVIAVSESEQAAMVRHRMAPADRVVCIENGIAPPVLPHGYDRTRQRRALGQAGAGLLIGTVARLTAQKNPGMFVEAAARVLRNLPSARFVWCGGGDLAESVQGRARALEIEHACRFLGHRNDAEQVMAALDLFWLTSDYEGLPYALLEALALRLPVLATDVVGTRDVLRGGAGLPVPQGDAEALASTTLMLHRRPERREQLAQAGYHWYAEYGRADRMVDATERLYTELVHWGLRNAPV